ncbi:MAG: serine/threonine protein kinase [Moraxellaceae bacterium]|nr:MAG: serine/threonine protein kinase [Moraxellaceae bacterium]
MTNTVLTIEAGQKSVAGLKPQNEDSIGIHLPVGEQLASKGVAMVIADGVSAAEAGKEASETCVRGFLSDYYSTPDSWSVKQSAHKVLVALNRWLYGLGQRYIDAEKGYVTTFSALIIKSHTAHVFHAGDSRIYRLRMGALEQITHDHVVKVSKDTTYLARAMGIGLSLEIDYKKIEVEVGDLFISTTDGIHDWMSRTQFKQLVVENAADLDQLCERLVEKGLAQNSTDNLSCQALRVLSLGVEAQDDALNKLANLPFPPDMEPGMKIDGWKVLKQIHASSRSQLYYVENMVSGKKCVMKTPSVLFEDDPAYTERFVMEEWVGARISSPYVVETVKTDHKRTFLYYLIEMVEGETIMARIKRDGVMEINYVVSLTEQIIKGLRAFHRRESLHQDIKPDNIVIHNDQAKIVDFGSVFVAGVDEITRSTTEEVPLGTLEYSAPEYRLNRPRSERSDQFSLAMVVYEMLTTKKPYDEAYQRAMDIKQFSTLTYTPAYVHNPLVPTWVDGALHKALQINADLRYESLSEFLNDLTYPNPEFLNPGMKPLIDRNPLLFWKGLSFVLMVSQVIMLLIWRG